MANSEISTGIYRANTYDNFYTLKLNESSNVFIDISGDNGTSSIYDSQMKYVSKTTSGTPLFLESGSYTVRASYSSLNLSVMNVYIPSAPSLASLPELSTGSYKASSWDNFYSLNIGVGGNLFLVAGGDSARLVIYDAELNFVKYSYNDPIYLNPGKYIVLASFNGYKNGVLNVNIPESMKVLDPAITLPPILSGDNFFDGSSSADVVQGFLGNDRFTGNFDYSNPDSFFGGDGIDSSVYHGLRTEYDVKLNETFRDLRKPDGIFIKGVMISDKVGSRDGKDYLHEVERIHFLDKSIALDIDGVAGQAYRLYNAAFDRTPDLYGLGYWIKIMDDGASLQDVANGFSNSKEFISLYGQNPKNDEIIRKLYENILDRTPEKSGYDYWLNVLDNKLASISEVLSYFSEGAENKNATAKIIGQGFEYIPYQ